MKMMANQMSEAGKAAPLTDDSAALWRAVMAADASRDGSFVYAVRSTGIYCRPSCPSRRPRRDKVAFFALPEAAEQAGFRACRRCRPDEAEPSDPALDLVRRACRAIDADEGAPTLGALGQALGAGPHHLQRVFTRIMGISPRAYADARRLARLKGLLKAGEGVAGATYGAGYGSSSRLYERAAGQLGMTPASYRAGGKGARIAFAMGTSPLGTLLVAATGKGVCMVSLGDSPAALERELKGDYPQAEIGRDEAALGTHVSALLRHLSGQEPDIRLPLDIRATAFQWRVWQALIAIPYGEHRSYGEIAAAIGRPGAARAVGRACGSNPVSLLIPCHRAVGSDGTLTGYRWGVERKRALLAQEAELKGTAKSR
jgi:AraC family transcriptional regulator of adaptative response/methylated-DNA-[protein]-cysteine methyltransferase